MLCSEQKSFRLMMDLAPKFSGRVDLELDFCPGPMADAKACMLS